MVTDWFGERGSFAMALIIRYVLRWDVVSTYHFNLTFTVGYRQMERQLTMWVEHIDQFT